MQNTTLDSIKDSIREELSVLRKDKTTKYKVSNNSTIKSKKDTPMTSKELLTDYFNNIKQKSKLNINHNNILNSKNLNPNSLEISALKNLNADELKTNNNFNNNINNNAGNNFIIYETFKNMLNKNKNKIENNEINLYDINAKIKTGRFGGDIQENKIENTNFMENDKIQEKEKINFVENNYETKNENKNDFNYVLNNNYFKENILENNDQLIDYNFNNFEIQQSNKNEIENNLYQNNNINQFILTNENNEIKYNQDTKNKQIFNEIGSEQISIIKDIDNLNDINENNFIQSNINKYQTSHFNSKNNNNNYLFPQNVLAFSTSKEPNKFAETKTNTNYSALTEQRLFSSKKFQYYRKDYFSLKRKYNALKGKYNLEKKKTDNLNLKLFYETHKNDDLIQTLKNNLKLLVSQIKSNVTTFNNLDNEIKRKQNEINQKNKTIMKQNELIKMLVKELGGSQKFENINIEDFSKK